MNPLLFYALNVVHNLGPYWHNVPLISHDNRNTCTSRSTCSIYL